jgi:hypothetical protein
MPVVSVREELELRKLELEAKHLERPAFKTPTFWISVVSALVAVIGVFAQNYLSKIEAAQAKLDKTEAEQLRDKAKSEITQLTTQRTSLAKVNADLTETNSVLTKRKQLLEQESVNRETQLNRLLAAAKAAPA